jgi:hypothetical protein
MFTEDDIVEITRKIHGTNARYGIVKKTKLSLFDKVKKFFRLADKWIDYEFSYMEQQTPVSLKALIKRYNGIRNVIAERNTDDLKNSVMGFLFAHFNWNILQLKIKGKGKKGIDAFYQSIVDYIDMFVNGTNGVKGAKQWLEEKDFNAQNDPVHYCSLCDKSMQNVKQIIQTHEKTKIHIKHVEASLTGTEIEENLTKNSVSRCLGCKTIIRGNISNLQAHWDTQYCRRVSPPDKMKTYEQANEGDENSCKIKKSSGMSVYQREQEVIRQEKAKEEEKIAHLKKLERQRLREEKEKKELEQIIKAREKLAIREAKLLKFSLSEYVDDIGEDGDSETYEALEEAFNEAENEILAEMSSSEPESENEPEPEPKKVIENIIIPSPSSDKKEIKVQEVAEESEEEDHLHNDTPSGAWMYQCGDRQFEEEDVDESIYGDPSPSIPSPVLQRKCSGNNNIVLQIGEAISV